MRLFLKQRYFLVSDLTLPTESASSSDGNLTKQGGNLGEFHELDRLAHSCAETSKADIL